MHTIPCYTELYSNGPHLYWGKPLNLTFFQLLLHAVIYAVWYMPMALLCFVLLGWFNSLQWHHNEPNGIPNHQRLDCLINHSWGIGVIIFTSVQDHVDSKMWWTHSSYVIIISIITWHYYNLNYNMTSFQAMKVRSLLLKNIMLKSRNIKCYSHGAP